MRRKGEKEKENEGKRGKKPEQRNAKCDKILNLPIILHRFVD